MTVPVGSGLPFPPLTEAVTGNGRPVARVDEPGVTVTVGLVAAEVEFISSLVVKAFPNPRVAHTSRRFLSGCMRPFGFTEAQACQRRARLRHPRMRHARLAAPHVRYISSVYFPEEHA